MGDGRVGQRRPVDLRPRQGDEGRHALVDHRAAERLGRRRLPGRRGLVLSQRAEQGCRSYRSGTVRGPIQTVPGTVRRGTRLCDEMRTADTENPLAKLSRVSGAAARPVPGVGVKTAPKCHAICTRSPARARRSSRARRVGSAPESLTAERGSVLRRARGRRPHPRGDGVRRAARAGDARVARRGRADPARVLPLRLVKGQ